MDTGDPLANLDKIHITDLLLRCIIGVNDWERTQKQDVLINVTLYADLSRPCQTDNLKGSIDYKEIKGKIIAMVEGSSFNLIERLANEIAKICLAHSPIKAVQVRVDKPGALRFAKSVGVEIFRPAMSILENRCRDSEVERGQNLMAEEAYIAVGSNIEPQDNILNALIALKTYVTITAISNFYRTSPVGKREQPEFINGVVKIKTNFKPRLLKFDVLRNIEKCLGRVRSIDKYTPRTIDLDLILYGSLVIDEPDFHLPDPIIRLYPFVAVPLLEIAPELMLPDTRTPLSTEPVIKLKGDLCLKSEFTARLQHRILT